MVTLPGLAGNTGRTWVYGEREGRVFAGHADASQTLLNRKFTPYVSVYSRELPVYVRHAGGPRVLTGNRQS